MVNVTLITNAGPQEFVIDHDKTLKQIFEEKGVAYQRCTNSLNSVPLKAGDVDKTLRELGVGQSCRICAVVKMDNAATVVVTGDAFVVKSGVKLEDWKKVLKYDPKFGLYDEEGKKLLFAAAIKNSMGSMNDYGAEFSSRPDQDGNAMLTMLSDPDAEDKVQLATDTLGVGLLRLNQLEELVAAKIEEANAKAQKIRDSIVVA